ncbi:phosphatidylinositol-specific phospholipase C domain-containing protein [Streptacidiphilus anmyonensis]|uniref:phosphatidylinositol-specific phospholipase C domain-containing protein n=1 Tax=Streptacidiphilus anmyonensis TaxID=405782 RepID=UPI0005AAA662|nr:phosphatidylinositol-specific phospholipase C domain-containing protein [Streptacidiphilus anmyonensis]
MAASRRPVPRRLVSCLLTAAACLIPFALPGGTAAAQDTGDLSLAAGTSVGLHNTYDDTSAFPYLAQALDAGTSLVELDTWVDPFTHEWKVSHANPLGNSNNCVDASSAADLYRGGANKDLGSCLDDIRIWLAAHPGHPPIMIKLEMKAGFDATVGLGPTQLDSLVQAHLGSDVYRPADLMAGYPSLDAAARANAWPKRSALAGKVILEAIPGTFEQANPFDHLWTDVEYAQHLAALQSAGQLGNAQIFPSVLGAASGDPRTRYSDATLRPWFVVFDGDAHAFVDGGIDTSWYDTNHYLLVMTDAQNVDPALSDTAPSQSDATARVAQLAAAHASFVSTDWTGLPSVLSEQLPRG